LVGGGAVFGAWRCRRWQLQRNKVAAEEVAQAARKAKGARRGLQLLSSSFTDSWRSRSGDGASPPASSPKFFDMLMGRAPGDGDAADGVPPGDDASAAPEPPADGPGPPGAVKRPQRFP
jgi:hypothetical protein